MKRLILILCLLSPSAFAVFDEHGKVILTAREFGLSLIVNSAVKDCMTTDNLEEGVAHLVTGITEGNPEMEAIGSVLMQDSIWYSVTPLIEAGIRRGLYMANSLPSSLLDRQYFKGMAAGVVAGVCAHFIATTVVDFFL